MPSIELVVVSINGAPFASWRTFSASFDADSPERTFQVSGSIEGGIALSFKPGNPVSITSNGDLIVSGFITKVSRKITNEMVDFTIEGKSKGSDMIKGSVDHETHEFRKKDIVQIAKDADPSGTEYFSDEQLEKIPVVRANVGQKVHAFIDKIAWKHKLFMCAEPDGRVRIGKHCKQSHSGGIVEGVNLFEGTVSESDEERCSEYKVKGHQPTGTGEQNVRYQQQAHDRAVRKGPVKVITPRHSLTRQEAKNVAEHAADTRHGDSVTLECTLQGFRDDGGTIWTPGWLVPCVIPSGSLDQDLALKKITLHQDEKHSWCDLDLCHPSALGGGGGSKAGARKKSSGFGPRS